MAELVACAARTNNCPQSQNFVRTAHATPNIRPLARNPQPNSPIKQGVHPQYKENSMPIAEGQPAPDFSLKDSKGNSVSLEDFRGKNVVVYFYPKDDTPGCTKEACGFRDLWQDIQAQDTVVLGISPDDAASHTQFGAKYGLSFTLLSDPDRSVMTAYGAWGEKNMYGKKTIGVIRSTVWIGPDGTVKKHWKKVADAAKHPEQVLAAIKGI